VMEAALFVVRTAGAVIDPHRGKMCKLFASSNRTLSPAILVFR